MSLVLLFRDSTPAAFVLSDSANIAPSGANTTARLTPPTGKTTADFQAGRIQDDENPTDAIDLASGKYTELEWSIKAVSGQVATSDVYEFRVIKSATGTPLDTYSVTPTFTVASAGFTLQVTVAPYPAGNTDLATWASADQQRQAYQRVKYAGVNFQRQAWNWSELETSAGVYDLTKVQALVNESVGLPISICVRIADSSGDLRPAYLTSLAHDHATVTTAYNALLDAINALGGNFKYLSLSDAIDSYLVTNPTRITPVANAITAAKTKAQTLWGADCEVNVSMAFASNGSWSTTYAAILSAVTSMGVAYYFVVDTTNYVFKDTNTSTLSATLLADLNTMATAAGKPIIISQFGVASGTTLSGSESLQLLAYQSAFTHFNTLAAAAKLKAVHLFLSDDLPDFALVAFGLTSGTPIYDFQASLGLRRTDGSAKPAWTEVVTQLGGTNVAVTRGAASGVGTATAVGQAAILRAGTAAGSSSAVAVGSSSAVGVGNASGVATATAVGQAAKVATGSSAGSSTALAQVAATAASAGSSTATAVGSSTATTAGSSSGSSSAVAVGSSVAIGVGNAAGTSAASATGSSTAQAAGSSAGVASATGVGRANTVGTGSAAGISTVTGVNGAGNIGTAAGSSSAVAVGSSVAVGVGNAAGSSSVVAVGASAAQGVGSAAGSGQAVAVGKSTVAAVGNSSGASSATGVNATGSKGVSAGTSSAVAVGSSLAIGVGNAAGSSSAVAVGKSSAAGTGSSSGLSAVSAVSKSTSVGVGTAAGTSAVAGSSRRPRISIIHGFGSSRQILASVNEWIEYDVVIAGFGSQSQVIHGFGSSVKVIQGVGTTWSEEEQAA